MSITFISHLSTIISAKHSFIDPLTSTHFNCSKNKSRGTAADAVVSYFIFFFVNSAFPFITKLQITCSDRSSKQFLEVQKENFEKSRNRLHVTGKPFLAHQKGLLGQYLEKRRGSGFGLGHQVTLLRCMQIVASLKSCERYKKKL